ncbi:MAG: hypothetical protein ACM3PY_07125 [Omnitrophica WOR_2 bacterium]
MEKKGYLAILLVVLLAACQLKPAAPGSTLYQDDFSDAGSGWSKGDDHASLIDYVAGGLRIYIKESHAARVSTPGLRFQDTQIGVDATRLTGPENNSFGIVCRLQDKNNFYFFQISSDGYYGIGKYKDGKLSLIGATQMQSYDAIGKASNHLRADCAGDTLSLYINGRKIAEVKDDDFSAGDVGLIAGTFDKAGTDIYFDHFIVK